MNKFSNFDDEDLFNASTTSNLASIFNSPINPKPDLNTSLTYTPPKQPKPIQAEKPANIPNASTQSSVICTKFVDAFKVVEKIPTSEGKCGIAIIGSLSSKIYDLILYKSKQDIITRAQLNCDFMFILEANNFVYFCDNSKCQWSVRFQSLGELDQFKDQVKECGGNVVSNSKPVNLEESRTSPVPTQDKDADTASDSSNNTQTKASILSRMAKMGQPILPKLSHTKPYEPSGSETEEEVVVEKVSKKRPEKRVKNPPAVLSNVPECVMVNGQLIPVASISQSLPVSTQPFLQGFQSQMMWNQPPPLTDPLNIFVAENRTHNCEMRMNISQLNSKLDQVLFSLNKTSASDQPVLGNDVSLSKEMELKELGDAIKKLTEQEELLHTDAAKKDLLINDLQGEAVVTKRLILKLGGENNILKDENDSLRQAKDECGLLKDQVVNLKTIIDIHEGKLQETESERAKNKELQDQVDTLQARLKKLDDQCSEFAVGLKEAMNSLYQQVMENFEDDNIMYKNVDIKAVLAPKLKSASFSIIDSFQKNFKNV